MAFPFIPVAAVSAAALLGYFLLQGGKKKTPGQTAEESYSLGCEWGASQGAADAKAGRPADAAIASNAAVLAQSNSAGSPSEYVKGVSECYAKSYLDGTSITTTMPGGGGGGGASMSMAEKAAKARASAQSDWGNGCARGFDAGWADAANGFGDDPQPSKSKSTAYKAAYTRSYHAAWAVSSESVISEETPSSGVRGAGLSECGSQFSEWWDANGTTVSGLARTGQVVMPDDPGHIRHRLVRSRNNQRRRILSDVRTGQLFSSWMGGYAPWWQYMGLSDYDRGCKLGRRDAYLGLNRTFFAMQVSDEFLRGYSDCRYGAVNAPVILQRPQYNWWWPFPRFRVTVRPGPNTPPPPPPPPSPPPPPPPPSGGGGNMDGRIR